MNMAEIAAFSYQFFALSLKQLWFLIMSSDIQLKD